MIAIARGRRDALAGRAAMADRTVLVCTAADLARRRVTRERRAGFLYRRRALSVAVARRPQSLQAGDAGRLAARDLGTDVSIAESVLRSVASPLLTYVGWGTIRIAGRSIPVRLRENGHARPLGIVT